MGTDLLRYHNLLLYLAIGLYGLTVGCSSSQKAGLFFHSSSEQNFRIDGSIEADSAVSAFIKPYANELEVQMQRVLATSTGRFEKDKPEGTLGNLAADIVRRRAALELGTWIDMSVMNNGGLRRPLTKGKIRVRDIYELMPFDNTLVVLMLKGHQVQQLADEIAQIGGEPVSGLRMRIKDNKAVDIMLGSRTLSADSTYLVATNSYLTDGGGRMSTLWNPVSRQNTGLEIRQIFIDYLENKRTIEPQLDGRIR